MLNRSCVSHEFRVGSERVFVMIIKDLRQHSPRLAQYTELRSQENRMLNIAYVK